MSTYLGCCIERGYLGELEGSPGATERSLERVEGCLEKAEGSLGKSEGFLNGGSLDGMTRGEERLDTEMLGGERLDVVI